MNKHILGVFSPFWSDEGTHFVLPHFQGMMRAFDADASVLDLNVEAAMAMEPDWRHLSGNGDGFWSNPEEIEDRIRRAGISGILKKALGGFISMSSIGTRTVPFARSSSRFPLLKKPMLT